MVVRMRDVRCILIAPIAAAQADLRFPANSRSGNRFLSSNFGLGRCDLYIVGPGDALQRRIQLGEKVSFGADDLHNAGHYVAILVAGSSSQSRSSMLSHLGSPRRLVFWQSLHDWQ